MKNTQSRSSFHSSSFNSDMMIRTGPKKLVRSYTDCLKQVLDMYVSHSSLTNLHLFLTGFAPKKFEVNGKMNIILLTAWNENLALKSVKTEKRKKCDISQQKSNLKANDDKAQCIQ